MMISTFRSALLAAAVVFAPLSTALHAQTPRTMTVVKIPFAFQNGDKTFPAGVYTVTRSSDHILAIQGKDVHGEAMMNISSAGPKVSSASKVVFHRYGNEYFLSEIWMKGQSDYIACFKTPAEKKALKTMRDERASLTGSADSATTVEVALTEPAR